MLVIALVSASLAIITLDYREGDAGPLAEAGRWTQTVMAPLQQGVSTVTRPIGDFFSGLAHLPSLERDNADLRGQVADLQTQIAGAGDIQDRLRTLEDLLGLKRTLDPAGIPAVVIGNGVSNFEWTITISAGSDDGVAVGQPVVAGSATSPRLVGLVAKVTPISADVQLLIDQNFAVAGRLSTTRATGLVRGRGEQDPRMDGIPQDTQISLNGDQPVQVFTVSYQINGQHGRYPPGILIGEVASVIQSTNALETAVTLRPAVDFSALEYVLVYKTDPSQEGSTG
ncbi:MAG: rod shape-determining protein MreC [Actinomycetota bacterium]|nr:rod shape-determining protein MreC [Actinomycetota bacterium]